MNTPFTRISNLFPSLFKVGLFSALSGVAHGDMQSLDDKAMSQVQGQSGITLEMDLKLSADRLSYYDDGQGVHVHGLQIGSSEIAGDGAFHRTRIDVTAGAGLNLDYLVEDRRIEFADVRLAGAPGVSMGGLFLDHSLDGYFKLRSGGAVGGEGYTFDTAYTMTGGRLGY